MMGYFQKKSDARDLVIAYKAIFSTTQGKQVLFDLMNRFHVVNTHRGEVFKEGQRSVILEIMRNCNIDLEKLDQFLKGEEQ